MCGVTEFYHASRPTRKQTTTGTWMYMPYGDEAPAHSPASSARSRRRRRKKLQPGDPSDGSSNGKEAAESETMTHDPIVEPSERPVPSFGRQQHASPAPVARPPSRPAVSQLAPPQRQNSDALLTALQNLVRQRTNDDDDWNSRKGPERGIRWRTGQHPPPPQWRYDSQDMRAFAKFSKKVKIWQIQMTPYASAADQALLLWGSLTGDAEQEVEHMTIE